MIKQNISTVDLIILGLIRNQEMSAYDLSKIQGIYELVKISTPAIYKNVIRLEKSNYLRSTSKKGDKRPDKKIYKITNIGETRFNELLQLTADAAINYFFDFNVPLLFVNSIEHTLADSIVQSVTNKLKDKDKYLTEQIKKFSYLPFPIGNLGNQQLELNRYIIEWIKTFDSDMKKSR